MTLKSICQQSAWDKIKEVIVVDSSRDDKTFSILDEYSGLPEFRMVLSNVRLSPAGGRNLGAGKASGDVLCFIDSDVFLAKDWLKEILAAYEDGCLAGGGSISTVKSQRDNVLALAQFYLQCNEYLEAGVRREKLFVPSCNMFCSRTLFRKVGGFPDIRASEDTLFFLRLKGIAGVHFIPTARAQHIFRLDWNSFLKNQRLLGRYVSIYRRQYYRSFIYWGIIPVILSPAFLIIKFFRMCRRITKAGTDHDRDFFRSFPVFLVGFMMWSCGFIQGFVERKNADSGSTLS
jgi:glycosyltransferase involved in cell wall biosynthesis